MKLTPYFKKELVKLGYPDDLEIEYSLGYCQGDGMAFYGKLRMSDLEAIFKRLYSAEMNDDLPAVQRVKNLLKINRWTDIQEMAEGFTYFDPDISIERNSYGNRYSHWNTMNLVDNSDSIDIDELDANQVEAAKIWDEFFDDLKQDIQETSKRLECYGYVILEAGCHEDTTVWEKRTDRFIVRLTEMLDEHFDIEDWDEEQPNENYQGFLEGKDRWLALRAEVLDKDGKTVFGEASLHGVVCGNDDKTYGGFKRELITEAIGNARELLSRYQVKAA